jgi:hypothetical protein
MHGLRRESIDWRLGVSLALLTLAAFFWMRSHHVHGQANFTTAAGRYALHSQKGRLALSGPPPANADANVSQWVADVNNDVLIWMEHRVRHPRPILFVNVFPEEGTGARKLHKTRPAAATPLLLRALDDPERFAAAHILLDAIEKQGEYSEWEILPPHRPDGSFHVAYKGLKVEMRPQSVVEHDSHGSSRIHREKDETARVDPASQRAVRDHWHDVFDVRIASVSYGWLVLALLIHPTARSVRTWRRIVRSKRSQCIDCGYDLRFSEGRCPECGNAAS